MADNDETWGLEEDDLVDAEVLEPSSRSGMAQPTPAAFRAKVVFFENVRNMARELAKARRAMGYNTLRGTSAALSGCEEVSVTAYQSGLIRVAIVQPGEHLCLETTNYVFDEAMIVEPSI